MKPASVSAPAALGAPAQTPNHPRRQPWWRIFRTKRFLFASIALHLLLALSAGFWIVQTVRPDWHQKTFVANPAAGEKATHALEHQVKLAKRQSTMSAPPTFKRVVSLSPSRVTLPALPAMPASLPVAPSTLPGAGVMPAGGFGMAGGGASGDGGGGGFTNFIGGLRITARKLGVALDVSGSVRAYQQEMHAYVEKVFKGSQVLEFNTAGFITVKSSRGSMGQDVLEFLNSPEKFDAIYIFSDFGETEEISRGRTQDLWPQVQQLIVEKNVKLYLHVLRKPGDDHINPMLYKVIQFAKSTGGAVKIGDLTRIDEGNTSQATNTNSR